jgi:hypothetical protein
MGDPQPRRDEPSPPPGRTIRFGFAGRSRIGFGYCHAQLRPACALPHDAVGDGGSDLSMHCPTHPDTDPRGAADLNR